MVDRQIMAKRIYIKSGPLQLEATLNDTDLAASLWNALPISAAANTWGDEIYFGIPVDAELENAQEVVDLGDLAYWPPGRAFCVFFGPTPASRGDEIRPASAVTVIGKVEGDSTILKRVQQGDSVTLKASG
jgi:hypothetical protein